MPTDWPLLPGYLYEVRVYYGPLGLIPLYVSGWWLAREDMPPVPVRTAGALGNAFAVDFVFKVLTRTCPAAVRYHGFSVQQWNPDDGAAEDYDEWPGSGACTAPGFMLPPQTSLLVQLKTSRVGRTYQGRQYIGWLASSLQDAGTFSGAQWILARDNAQAYLGPAVWPSPPNAVAERVLCRNRTDYDPLAPHFDPVRIEQARADPITRQRRDRQFDKLEPF